MLYAIIATDAANSLDARLPQVGSRRYMDHPANHRGPQSGFIAAL